MKNSLENKLKHQGFISQKWKTISTKAEVQLIILLLILAVIGAIYNIASYHSNKSVNLNICPLCDEPTNHVIYEQRNQTYTF